jgi:CheY-like chemotaxis protein
MQQVLVNLCVNARDAMPSGGVLEVLTRRVESDALPRAARREGCQQAYVHVCVRDTGCGMDDETAEQAFDPFFTTKPMDRGTGLGLAIVYNIVEAHGGVIDISSELGQGTNIDIFFPATTAPCDTDASEALPSAVGEERILVVEDEEMVAGLLKTILESRGYSVTVLHNPQEAVDLIGADWEKPFDLAIVDYELPLMTGDRCLAAMCGRHPNLKGILISGGDLDDEVLEFKGGHVLQKPFSVPTIVQLVRDVIDG